MTSEETIKDVTDFGRSLGKRVVVAQDRPGFIVNRVLTSILFNAVRLLEEGVADKESIDAAMEVGLGLPMGPFRLLDLIGMDTVVLGSDALFKELNDPQYACRFPFEEWSRLGGWAERPERDFMNMVNEAAIVVRVFPWPFAGIVVGTVGAPSLKKGLSPQCPFRDLS